MSRIASGPKLAAVAGAALAAFFIFRAGDAAAAESPDPEYSPPMDGGDYGTGDPYNPELPSGIDMAQRTAAMLFAIRNAEHTPAAVRTNADYATFYGGSRFYDFGDHPALTGEKRGVPLTDAQCKGAGFGPGCVSTAAGAYQINKPTWLRVRQAGRWGPRLPDFSAASQDEAARRLLAECGALSMLEAGDTVRAIQRAGTLWASLPGSTAGQKPKDMGTVLAWFDQGMENYG